MFQIECLENSQSNLGEGCVYNHFEAALYWVDIKDKKIYRYCEQTQKVQIHPFNKTITSLAFYNQKQIIATTQDGFELIDLNEKTFKHLLNPEAHLTRNRFNDGKCDPLGRYFAGTMDDREEEIKGSLYRFDGTHAEKLEQNLFISNGLGWNRDSTKFYLTDSPKGLIYSYDYDLENGTIHNQHVFAKVDSKDGYPDGLTVDSEDCLWSCHWGGSKITRYLPSGKVDFVINLPTSRVTSCCFGGDKQTVLYVTTAKYGLSPDERKNSPLSGCTFKISTHITGQKMNQFSFKQS